MIQTNLVPVSGMASRDDSIDAGKSTYLWAKQMGYQGEDSVVASKWIMEGTALEIVEARRNESIQRLGIAKEVLLNHPFQFTKGGNHIWMELNGGWRSSAFAKVAEASDVLVNPSDFFTTGRIVKQNAIRVSIGAARKKAELKTGLERLAQLFLAPKTDSVTRY